GALGGFAAAGLATQLALAGGREILPATLEVLARIVAALDRLGETNFVVFGEQRVLPDIGEVETDEVFLVPLDTLFGQEPSLLELEVMWIRGGSGPTWAPPTVLSSGDTATGERRSLRYWCGQVC